MHFPGSRLRLTLSATLPCEARTFLTVIPFGTIPRDRLAKLRIDYSTKPPDCQAIGRLFFSLCFKSIFYFSFSNSSLRICGVLNKKIAPAVVKTVSGSIYAPLYKRLYSHVLSVENPSQISPKEWKIATPLT